MFSMRSIIFTLTYYTSMSERTKRDIVTAVETSVLADTAEDIGKTLVKTATDVVSTAAQTVSNLVSDEETEKTATSTPTSHGTTVIVNQYPSQSCLSTRSVTTQTITSLEIYESPQLSYVEKTVILPLLNKILRYNLTDFENNTILRIHIGAIKNIKFYNLNQLSEALASGISYETFLATDINNFDRTVEDLYESAINNETVIRAVEAVRHTLFELSANGRPVFPRNSAKNLFRNP